MIPQPSGVAYCGLYCGGCVIREGNIGELADSLCRTMARPEFCKLAEGLPKLDVELFGDLKDHAECLRVLKAMRTLDCRKLCRQGGGSSECRIRECCREKEIDGCWECEELETCETLAWLVPVHQNANLVNLRTIRDKGMKVFLAGEKLW